MSDTLPMARDYLRANSPETEGRAVKRNPLLGPNRAIIFAWHRSYADAAHRLAPRILAGEITESLPPLDEPDDIAEAVAFAVLCNTGDERVSVQAMKWTDANRVLRGSTRLFLRNASVTDVAAWLRELAAWETRWADEVERTEAAS